MSKVLQLNLHLSMHKMLEGLGGREFELRELQHIVILSKIKKEKKKKSNVGLYCFFKELAPRKMIPPVHPTPATAKPHLSMSLSLYTLLSNHEPLNSKRFSSWCDFSHSHIHFLIQLFLINCFLT